MGILDSLDAKLRKNYSEGTGVCFSKDRMYILHIKKEESWVVSEFVEIPWNHHAVLENEAVDTAELYYLHSMRMPKKEENLAVCIPDDEIYYCTGKFPNLMDNELQEAAYWEIEGSGWFGEAAFRSAAKKKESSGDEYHILAVNDGYAKTWEKAWAEAGTPINFLMGVYDWKEQAYYDDICLTVYENEIRLPEHIEKIPEDAIPAVCAAMSACQEPLPCCMDVTCLERKERWDWKKINILAACFFIVPLLFLSGMDLWTLSDVRYEKEDTHRKYMEFATEKRKMEELEDCCRQTERKNHQLVQLSKASIPWRSILVHFGSMTQEGVYITELGQTENHQLEIKGKAVNFDALADFLRMFEEDKDFFADVPSLKESKIQKDGKDAGMVEFSLQFSL